MSTYNGISLIPVNTLNDLMHSIVKDFDPVGIHGPNDFDYNPLSIFHIDGEIDVNKPDFATLFDKYPTISILEKGFIDEFKLLRIPKNYIQADRRYIIADINCKIKEYNSSLIFPSKTDFLKEKAACLEWRSYNTPSYKDISITPLHGTDFPFVDLKDKSPLNIYTQ